MGKRGFFEIARATILQHWNLVSAVRVGLRCESKAESELLAAVEAVVSGK
jgi:hypothetical protein